MSTKKNRVIIIGIFLLFSVVVNAQGKFYTKDGKSHKMVDEQFSANSGQRKDNLKRYTNLVVLTSTGN